MKKDFHYYLCLSAVCRERNIVYYQQSFLLEFSNWLPFYWEGYHVKQEENFILRVP